MKQFTDIYGNLTWLNKKIEKLCCLVDTCCGGGEGSIEINPTNEYVPVRISELEFGDSAIRSNIFSTSISHTFDTIEARLFISAEEGFSLKQLYNDGTQLYAGLYMNPNWVNINQGNDGIDGFITIEYGRIRLRSSESGNISNIDVSEGDITSISQTIDGGNQLTSRVIINTNNINTYVYDNHNGDYESAYSGSITAGGYSITMSDQSYDNDINISYSSIGNFPVISTYVRQNGGEQGSGFLLQKNLLQLIVFDDPNSIVGTFKIYISNDKVKYNYQSVYTFSSNALAIANGLVAGDIYRNNTGVLHIVH